MAKSAAKIVGAIGSVLSLVAGLLWHLSAIAQLKATAKVSPASSYVEQFTYLAAEHNAQAAFVGMLAGILLGLAVFLDD